mmetsp:Transcript_17832/g.37240  ORF Transcript_17832/g.37240 Transcript_17832/m.37240 type:complete len:235 (-) Transcript_17832:422-1126(-)
MDPQFHPRPFPHLRQQTLQPLVQPHWHQRMLRHCHQRTPLQISLLLHLHLFPHLRQQLVNQPLLLHPFPQLRQQTLQPLAQPHRGQQMLQRFHQRTPLPISPLLHLHLFPHLRQQLVNQPLLLHPFPQLRQQTLQLHARPNRRRQMLQHFHQQTSLPISLRQGFLRVFLRSLLRINPLHHPPHGQPLNQLICLQNHLSLAPHHAYPFRSKSSLTTTPKKRLGLSPTLALEMRFG